MITILLDTYVEMKWHNRSKKWYTDRGYKFTSNGDAFMVKVEDLQPGSNVRVNCACDYCGKTCYVEYQDYFKNTRDNIVKFACPSCRMKKIQEYGIENYKSKYFSRFLEICDERGYIPLSTFDDCKTTKTKVRYICPKHGEQESIFYNMDHGSGCPKCAHDLINKKNTLPIERVIRIIEGKNGNKLINPEEYDKVKTKNLKVQCGQCGDIFVTSLSSIIAGGGACRKCGLKNLGDAIRHDVDYVTNVIESKNGNKLLNRNDYIDARENNLLVECGNCGNIFSVSLSNYEKNITGRCPNCNEKSVGEFMIAALLDRLSVNYIRQYKFDGCKDQKPLPFDFYLPDYNLCIEFDGLQHFQPWYGDDIFVICLLHDAMKNNFCKWNGIDLLRIPYWETKNIESIIMDKLNLVA